MPSEPLRRHATAIRITLLIIGVGQALTGLQALLAPRSFFTDFPLGRGWVATLGDGYNEHLVVDVGSTFLALGGVLIFAAILLDRRVVQVALAAFLLYSLPHFVYHLTRLGDLPTGDDIANAVTTGITVVAPAALLLMMRRPQA
jgi:hypothetical protein